MNKVELLAPAKDIDKAKLAIDYGADAVYIGGKQFSLRSRASNFSLEDIGHIVDYAHRHKSKIFVTTNIVFHDDDFIGFKDYLKKLQDLCVDAVIVSSIGLIEIIKEIVPKIEVHVSTQLSICNTDSISVLKSLGADRVILARECSIDDIREIEKKVDLPIEVFIHGGMCSNYSGRCTLSNRMTNRDANRGGCAHSCRWKYKVFNNNDLISDPNCLFSLSSKDLCAVEYIEDMVKAGVSSLKIEGRMKSEYYVAQVVKTYRSLIDELVDTGHLSRERIDYYEKELKKAENRPSSDGFLSGTCDYTKHLYDENGAGVTHDYVAVIKDYDEIRHIALVETKNVFNIGEKLEVFGPDLESQSFDNRLMFDSDWKSIESATKPTELIYLRIPFDVKKNYMIRKAD